MELNERELESAFRDVKLSKAKVPPVTLAHVLERKKIILCQKAISASTIPLDIVKEYMGIMRIYARPGENKFDIKAGSVLSECKQYGDQSVPCVFFVYVCVRPRITQTNAIRIARLPQLLLMLQPGTSHLLQPAACCKSSLWSPTNSLCCRLPLAAASSCLPLQPAAAASLHPASCCLVPAATWCLLFLGGGCCC